MHQRTLTMLAQQFPCFLRVYTYPAHTNGSTFLINELHDVVFLELSFNAADSNRQDTGCLLTRNDFHRLRVEVKFTFRKAFTMSYPFFILDTSADEGIKRV